MIDASLDLLLDMERAGPDWDEVIYDCTGPTMRVLSARRDWLREQRAKKG
jgi:hypothetical protein